MAKVTVVRPPLPAATITLEMGESEARALEQALLWGSNGSEQVDTIWSMLKQALEG